MNFTRREILALSVAGLVPTSAFGGRPRAVAALAFDGLALFDARPVWAKVESVFPGHGAKLTMAWRARLFEYQWLHSLAGRYVDFLQAAGDALRFAARQTGLKLSAGEFDELMAGFSELKAWPDVKPALEALRARGLRLAVLSNMTQRMLDAGLHRAGLRPLFEHVLSTDAVRSYKPAAAAYQMGCDAFGLPRERIGFVAFAGWDVAGAKWFGFPTYWLNRTSSPPEELGAAADVECADMPALVAGLTA